MSGSRAKAGGAALRLVALLFGGLVGVAIAATAVSAAEPTIDPATTVLTLDRGALWLGDAKTPPAADGPGWQTVALPDDWSAERPEVGGVGWYRFTFDLERLPEAPLASYLEYVSMNASLWLNGSWIGQQGRMEPPVAQNWNRPLLFALPTGLLQSGENRLDVRLYRLPDCYGGLGPVRVGDAVTLGRREAQAYFWRVFIARASSLLGGFFAVAMLAFYAASRDPAYASFAIVCVAIAINDLNFHVRDIPVSSSLWEAVVCSGAIVSGFFFWIFARRFAGRSWSRRDLAAVAGIAPTGLLFVVDHRLFHPIFNGLALVAIGFCMLGTLQIARSARRLDPPMAKVYAAIAVLTLGFVFHDFALQVGLLEQPAPLFYPWIGLLLVLGFGTGLTRRFIRAFHAAEHQRELLARRVEEKRLELESRFAEVRTLESERLIARERERIMREMHDGVGGQLVRTLSLLESGRVGRERVAGALREALDDMRTVIDSLDPNVDDLGMHLGMLRGRLERSLQGSGVELVWRVDPAAPAVALGADATLQVLRIVQEAVTNTVKHAKASRLEVVLRAQHDPDSCPGLAVEVCDDGIGMGSGAGQGGRGIANMRRRAELIGARIEIASGDAGRGTRVRLWIPLP